MIVGEAKTILLVEDEPTLQTQKLRRKYKLEYHAKFPSREHSRRALRAYDARKDWGACAPFLDLPPQRSFPPAL